MAQDTGLDFQGTEIRISEDGVAYNTVGCVTSFDYATGSKAEIDTTCSTDTEKTFKFGLQDTGTISIDIWYSNESPGAATYQASYMSDDPFFFEIEYSDNAGVSGTIKSFAGYVTEHGHSGSVDEVLSGSFTVKLTGPVTTEAPVAA